MIVVVNYGLGNVQAFANIYKRLNIPAAIASSPDQLQKASKIILPGVGSFDWAMKRLSDSGMRELLDMLVMKNRIPILGICVGMQIMAGRSDEGKSSGLGWIEAEVKKFDISLNKDFYLPHMGWNDVAPCCENSLFKGIKKGARFYFLHSYYFLPKNQSDVLLTTDYNGPFASGVHRQNVFGVQFHPEKSHQYGIQMLKNFAELP